MVIEDVDVRRSWIKGIQELSVCLLLLNNEQFTKNTLKEPCKQEHFIVSYSG